MNQEQAFGAACVLGEAKSLCVAAACAMKRGDSGTVHEAEAVACLRTAADSFGLELVPKSDREQNKNIKYSPNIQSKFQDDGKVSVIEDASYSTSSGGLPQMNGHLSSDAKARKATPMCTGVLDYFPLALAEIARVSKIGNDQHNPGQPLHWDRSKSTDHADCIIRHLADRGTIDIDGMRHSGKLAWRALALLQTELEAEITKQ